MNQIVFERIMFINGKPLVQYHNDYIDDNITAQEIIDSLKDETIKSTRRKKQ